MKNNRERILEYFSGVNPDELKFLSDLNSDSDLYDEFEKVKNELSAIDAVKNLDIEESYYSSLLPRVHSKLSKKTSFRFTKKYIYGLSSVSVLLVLFFVFRFNSSPGLSSSDILEELIGDYKSSELLDVLDNNFTALDYFKTESYSEDYDEIFSDISDQVSMVYETSDLSSLYSNEYIENISEEQLDDIINQLENKKYF